MKIKDSIIFLLNRFCFSKFHDHNCNGCIFKNFEKCPLNTAVEKLERNVISEFHGKNNTWTFFVLNFDNTCSNNAPTDTGIHPLVYLVPRDKIKSVKKFAREAGNDFWSDDTDPDLYIDDIFEKYLTENGIKFMIVGPIELTFGERRGTYLDKHIPTERV